MINERVVVGVPMLSQADIVVDEIRKAATAVQKKLIIIGYTLREP